MNPEFVTIVGVDCATQPEKTGLALGRLAGSEVVIDEVRRATRKESAAQIVRQWMGDAECVLLALDAPLGWPAPLGAALKSHRAGTALMSHADVLFRRMTDQDIEDRLAKRPFEVGANLIARTAWAALAFLDDIRMYRPVELAWSPKLRPGVHAIEVYPAATRKSLGGPAGPVALDWLEKRVRLPAGWIVRSAHEADAIVCVIAGAEFLMGRSKAPDKGQLKRAQQEGWIWVGSGA